ncbi:hypothetical protein AB3N04_05740 [Alkalihalophilus sp. As8PL]|uniref:Uncharacterized protein n=1 Tax=Alkalihalophilus sp. As8PL TaxID=3237103 RepID=A0AB39BVI5_9BACI
MKNHYFSHFPFAELRSQDGRACFKICSFKYAYPHAKDAVDADWHRNYLNLSLPGFKSEVDEIILNGIILDYFIKELQAFEALHRDKVNLDPIEPYFWLGFSYICKKSKTIKVKGYVQYPAGIGSVLNFDFQTDLPSIIKFRKGLEGILSKFPAVYED